MSNENIQTLLRSDIEVSFIVSIYFYYKLLDHFSFHLQLFNNVLRYRFISEQEVGSKAIR